MTQVFAQPSDGYAYNRHELEALATLPAPHLEIEIRDLAAVYEFHRRSEKLGFPPVVGITDKKAAELIERAIVADRDDPDPEIEKDILLDDHLNREGQWPPSQALPETEGERGNE